MSFKSLNNLVGWLVFGVAVVTYALTAEPTGSLWDCGEFIAGAYKLQVVHPPGAPLFILVGRMFTYVAELISDNPEHIAYSVNLMSGICTAFAALFIFWSTTILAKLTLVGRGELENGGQQIAVLGAGAAAGLATTFSTSIWFSAVEGEVYAMSTFFTALVLWASLKWYHLPDSKNADRWLVFTAYMAGLSIGVHLLSLLVFPTIALLFYFKKFKVHTWMGVVLSALAGVGILVLVQNIIILRLPGIGAGFELFFVNTLGLGFGSGLMFFVVLLIAATGFGIYYADRHKMPILQRALVSFAMILMGFSTYGVVIIRANANPPINMNAPADVFSLVTYLNREQYGDRPLVKGPHYKAQPIDTETDDRYGPVGDRYEVVDMKISYKYRPSDQMFFPRVSHYDKVPFHDAWMQSLGFNPGSSSDMGSYNTAFFVRYHLGWMYFRYFFWNFVGKQNAEQGYYPWDSKSGHWMSGIAGLDGARTYNQSQLPRAVKEDTSRNFYYFLPLIFGLLGLVYMGRNNPNDTIAILALFAISGLGIIVQSNQPPGEPRERDYVLIGSFMMFCIWIGMGVLALFQTFTRFVPQRIAAIGAMALVLTAPAIMGYQNWDDHSRADHYGARDYAVNFLESCAPNAIVFTHGDNDTYPLWYAQEVEGIRTDVRVVNLSLLAVDWYIEQLRRKINDSEAIKLSISSDALRGFKRNRVMYPGTDALAKNSTIQDAVRWMGDNHPLPTAGGGQTESFIPVKELVIPVDRQAVLRSGVVTAADSARILNSIAFKLPDNDLIKDELAILDILASNLWERPIYFAVTCRPEKFLGLEDYLQLEGMALRVIPIKTPSDGQFGVIGSGRIATDLMYKNIMEKFKWGNFDDENKNVFIDRSYMPSIVSMRIGFLRMVDALIKQGDNDRAMKALDKFFDAYPNNNFPYDWNTYYIVRMYYNAGDPKRAIPHLKTLSREIADWMKFYNSLSPEDRRDFEFEEQRNRAAMQGIQQLIEQNDEATRKEINDMFAPFAVANIPQN